MAKRPVEEFAGTLSFVQILLRPVTACSFPVEPKLALFSSAFLLAKLKGCPEAKVK